MNQADKIAESIIKFLRASDKLELLPQVVERLEKEVSLFRGENTAVITSSKPLNKEELNDIEKQLLRFFGRKLVAVNRIDPQIIGGFVIQVSDKVIDLSLESYLNALEEKITHENN